MTDGPIVPTAYTWVGSPLEPPDPSNAVELPAGYVDKGLLGRGGMGEVRLVWDEGMSREVAIKILRPEVADDADLLQRFIDESETMAKLAHPSIVTVHARGELSDGRPWYVMRLVRGTTLLGLLAEPRPNLRHLLGYLMRVAQGIAHAHAQGMVHCDLKPENVLVGEFDEVQIPDWGIAQRVNSLNRRGLGTPPYRAPEQQRGGTVEAGTDVFALGVMLTDIHKVCRTELLTELVDRARANTPADRPTAAEFAEAIRATLDGEEARERAIRTLLSAATVRDELDRVEADARRMRNEGEAMLRALGTGVGAAEKHEAWALLDQADRCDADAESIRTRWFRIVHTALQIHPDLPEAHELLADHHHRRAVQAAERADPLEDLRHRELLRPHDRLNRYTAFLEGRSTLTLHTEREGIRVTLSRFELEHRRLVARPVKELGRTPLDEVDVPSGSLLLTLHLPEGRTVDLPALVERGSHWVTVRPGADRPWQHRLPSRADLEDACWIPAGWFVSGGDPMAIDRLRRRRLFVGDRLVHRFPITNRQYLRFLDALWARGAEEEAWDFAPGSIADGGAIQHAVTREPQGFVLEGWSDGVPWQPDWPVTLITHTAATAFARWWAEEQGQPWRLPVDQEAEKAARGVDGRPFPWGGHFEPEWARVFESAGSPISRASVYDHPDDRSVYGVRGVAGNVRVWCCNRYEQGGPADGTEVSLEAEMLDAPDDEYHVRGGAWISSGEILSRCAGRFGGHRERRFNSVGIRLVRE